VVSQGMCGSPTQGFCPHAEAICEHCSLSVESDAGRVGCRLERALARAAQLPRALSWSCPKLGVLLACGGDMQAFSRNLLDVGCLGSLFTSGQALSLACGFARAQARGRMLHAPPDGGRAYGCCANAVRRLLVFTHGARRTCFAHLCMPLARVRLLC